MDFNYARLRLNVSNLCNYACPNCHVFGITDNKMPAKQMTIETMIESIETYTQFLAEQNEKRLRISIYGGETFLNKKAVFKVVGHFGTSWNGVYLEWVMNTNGSLISEEDIEIVKRLKIDLHISCDGGAQVHNITRPTKSKQLAFDQLMSALSLVRKHQLSAQLNSYVMPQNIDSLGEIVDIAKDHGIRRVYLDHFYSPNSSLGVDLIFRKYKEAFLYGRMSGVALSAPWAHVFKRIKNQGDPRRSVTKSVEVSVDGTFFSDAFPRTKGAGYKLSELAEFLNGHASRELDDEMNRFYTEKCQDCELYRSCCGTAIRQFAYHTHQEVGYEGACGFMRSWIRDLTKATFLEKRRDYVVVSHFPVALISEVVKKIDEASAAMSVAFGKIPQNFLVLFLDSRVDFSIHSGGRDWPSWVSGMAKKYCYFQYGTELLAGYGHEICHIYLWHFAKYELPLWLAEGLCEYFNGRKLDLVPSELLRAGSLPDILTLESSGPGGFLDLDPSERQQNLYYSVSHSFVAFLIERIGWDSLRNVLIYLGTDFETSLHQITQLNLAQLEMSWREQLRLGI